MKGILLRRASPYSTLPENSAPRNFQSDSPEANFHERPHGDIYSVPDNAIPPHNILCAGFPCQPFRIAGVSKKPSLGRKHGFEDKDQGNRCEQVLHISYCLTSYP